MPGRRYGPGPWTCGSWEDRGGCSVVKRDPGSSPPKHRCNPLKNTIASEGPGVVQLDASELPRPCPPTGVPGEACEKSRPAQNAAPQARRTSPSRRRPHPLERRAGIERWPRPSEKTDPDLEGRPGRNHLSAVNEAGAAKPDSGTKQPRMPRRHHSDHWVRLGTPGRVVMKRLSLSEKLEKGQSTACNNGGPTVRRTGTGLGDQTKEQRAEPQPHRIWTALCTLRSTKFSPNARAITRSRRGKI